VFCGIDPGREKFGLAIGNREELAFSAIIPFGKAAIAIRRVFSSDIIGLGEWKMEGVLDHMPAIERVYLGDGTNHAEYERMLRDGKIDYILADERMTTLEARELYWSIHPPSGIARLLPRSLRTPPRPVDDLAAWAITRRALLGE
jgi:RNase H-fold protein (predicted Holliday junction resolvase)